MLRLPGTMNDNNHLDLKRIQALTDAIFAVAMTLLVLDMKIPEDMSPEKLYTYFNENIFPRLLIYAISFITLGIFWINSHFHHHILQKTDKNSSWLNIHFLLVICLIPFSSALLKNYLNEKISLIVYSINLILACFMNWLMLYYAWRKKYTKPNFSNIHYKTAMFRVLFPACCYLLGLGVCFFSTAAALVFFLLPMLAHTFPEKELPPQDM